jgi:trigger factor
MVDVEVAVEGQVIHSSKNSYVGTGSKGIFGVEIADLPEKLTGRNRNETVEIEFELPKTSALEYGEELAGKQARCTFKINEIKTLKIPEANDEWAKEVGLESLDDLKEKVKEQVTAAKEQARNRYVEKKILDHLLDICGFEVPTDMIETRAHELTEYKRYQLLKAGVEAEKINADLDSYRDLSRQEIERNFREDLVLSKIAELENLFVTEDEVNGAIAQIALSRGQAPDQLQGEMESRGLVSRLRSDLLESRVKEFLREKAEVELLPPGSLSKEEKPEEAEQKTESEEIETKEEEETKK